MPVCTNYKKVNGVYLYQKVYLMQVSLNKSDNCIFVADSRL